MRTRIFCISVLYFFFILPLLESCKKGGSSSGTTAPASVVFVNTSLNVPNADIYSNGTLLYNDIAFPDSTGYLNTPSGLNRLSVVNYGTQDTVLTGAGLFTPGKQYTVFLKDTLSAGVGIATIQDSLPTLRPGYVGLRFLNLSNTSPSLDLYAVSAHQYFFTDRFFGEADAFSISFMSFPAGNYTFDLYASGTVVPLATLSGIDLQGGKVYTLFASGVQGGVGNRDLGIGVIRHN